MLIALFIYLADVVSKINLFTYFVLTFTGTLLILIIIYKIIKFINDIQGDNHIKDIPIKNNINKLLIVFVITIIIHIIIPKEKTMYMMAGAYLGTEFITNKVVSDKLEKVNKIIDFKLNEIIKEYEKSVK